MFAMLVKWEWNKTDCEVHYLFCKLKDVICSAVLYCSDQVFLRNCKISFLTFCICARYNILSGITPSTGAPGLRALFRLLGGGTGDGNWLVFVGKRGPVGQALGPPFMPPDLQLMRWEGCIILGTEVALLVQVPVPLWDCRSRPSLISVWTL